MRLWGLAYLWGQLPMRREAGSDAVPCVCRCALGGWCAGGRAMLDKRRQANGAGDNVFRMRENIRTNTEDSRERRDAQAAAAEGCASGEQRAAGDYPAAEGCAVTESVAANDRRAALFFVGNQLMLDDGIGHAAYEELPNVYCLPDNVDLFDVGCMTMDMISYVRDYDFLMTIDAVDDSGEPAGTVFRYAPEDVARGGMMASLHDLKLANLFDTADLLGYEARGMCLGMQVLNADPEEYTIGLTKPCADALPLLIETIAAELDRNGFAVERRA